MRLHTLLITILTLCCPALYGQYGQLQFALQPVASYIPPDNAACWDFSDLEHTAREVDARVLTAGDSLIEISLPGIRYGYAAKSDTLRRIFTETRFFRLTDSVRPVISSPFREECLTFPVHQRGMAFHHDFIAGSGSMTLHPDQTGILIAAPGDTIHGVVLRRTTERILTAVSPRRIDSVGQMPDSLRFTRTRESYTWVLPGSPFPLARTEVATDSTSRGSASESESWIRLDRQDDTDASTAHAPRYAPAAPRRPLDCLNGFIAPAATDATARLLAAISQAMSVSVTPSGIALHTASAATTAATPAIPVTALLTDILGRVLSSGVISSHDSSCMLSTPELPPGEYLLSLVHGENRVTRKIILH